MTHERLPVARNGLASGAFPGFDRPVTLHLIFSCPAWILQVGDRLVTTDGTIVREWDPRSNKSILVRADNGTALICYAGCADLTGVPTDQRLAEHISGAEPVYMRGRGQSGPALTSGPYRFTLRDVGDGVGRLMGEFQSLPVGDPRRRGGLQVRVTGWTWKRRAVHRPVFRPRAFMLDSRHSGAVGAAVTTTTTARDFQIQGGHLLSLVGQRLPDGPKAAVIAALESRSRITDRELEDALVTCIRAVSEEDPTVGKALLSMCAYRNGLVEVRYHRDIDSEVARQAVGFTPWVLARGVIHPASVFTGGMGGQWSVAGVPMTTVPPLDTGRRWSLSSQPRPSFGP